MNLLLLGGTRFVGRHITQAALAAGHNVTLFHRGRTGAQGLEGANEVFGDRNHDLHFLDARTWDAVVDTSGYLPIDAQIAARFFAGRTASYVFISTISVYDVTGAPLDEGSPLARIPRDADRRTVTVETYGPLKALCEQIVHSTFRHRASIVRPGLVAGPYDPTDRFTYWPLRVAAGGAILAPESPSIPLQYIDARDLAQFVLRLAERSTGGTYNAVTTPGSITFGDLIASCARAAAKPADVRYVDAAELQRQGVEPWSDLPLWIPGGSPDAAIVRASNARARTQGLRLRPLYDTVRDTLGWARRANKRWGALGAGLTPQREHEILAATALGRPSASSG